MQAKRKLKKKISFISRFFSVEHKKVLTLLVEDTNPLKVIFLASKNNKKAVFFFLIFCCDSFFLVCM